MRGEVRLEGGQIEPRRPGGAAVRSATFNEYDEEVNRSLEVGAKFESADRRVRVNGAAYHNWISGRQLAVQTSAFNPGEVDTINSPGTTRVWGLEIEASVTPIDGLTLNAGYGFADSKRPLVRVLGALRDPGLPLTPEHQGTAAVDYVLFDRGFGKLMGHVDWNISSGYDVGAFTPANAPKVTRNVWNAQLSLANIPVGDSRARVTAWIKNIFDKETLTYVIAVPGDTGFGGLYSPPRTYGVEVGFRF
ncbi:TonB-dependent receptor [Sphingobium sp.]|uniref:TonB-dependent receptor n=1 Tax=Sphingobium sp. TaxID=1912891 RepID=UPI002E24B6F3